ncbi:Cytochrome P450 CYP749A22 [Linum perenne]
MILYGYFQVALSLLAILLSSIFLLGLAAFLNTTLRKPILLRRKFNAKGINGPAYRFFFGNAREILKMKAEASAKPMSSLSHNIFPRLQPHLPAWTDKYGKSFVFWMGPEPMLLISEPELVRVVLNETGKDYQKMEVKGYMLKLFGDGLATSRGEKWAKMKKLANHAFQGDSLKNMIPSMIASTEMMLERWNDHLGEEGKTEIDAFEEFRILTSEIISRTAFGSSYLEGEKVFGLLMKMVSIISRNHYKVRIPGLQSLFRTGDEHESAVIQQEIKSIIINMVSKRKEENSTSSATDFLGMLLKAYTDPDRSNSITLDDLVDECKTFYVAGHETTTSSLTWTVLLLALHSEWQDKAREQVVKLFGKDTTPTPDGISRLSILTMIINESLRLYPPVFHVSRRVERDVRLGGKLMLSKGTEVYIPNLAVHHDTGTWGEDAQLFKPMGARNCVGMNFAITEEKIALSMILQRYRFRLSDKYVHSPAQVLTSCPKHGLQIVLEKL